MAVYIDTRIDAATRKYALLGARLAHTWSPQIHNSLFGARGLNAVYLPLPVEGHALADAVEVLRQSFQGFNVTIPYKEAVVPMLDELDATASACRAVNTVSVGEDGGLTGYNTDGVGLTRALEEAWIGLGGIDALIVGGGGAARVAAYELLRRESRVTLGVREPARAERLVADLSGQWRDGAARLQLISLETLESEARGSGDLRYDLLLNGTPVGMFPNDEDCPVSEAVIARCEAVFDAVYNPPETRLLALARAHGLKCAGGFGMLFYQAVEAQRVWLGGVPHTRAQREIRKALEQML
jgi:shikimate dehydrogenase